MQLFAEGSEKAVLKMSGLLIQLKKPPPLAVIM
jgi:hypothetical protein